jgi:DNA-binding beta-propeller fold protein YncE
VYNQKLYSLDSVNGQIYKHNPTQTGYDRGAVWIKDTAGKDLTQGVSFSIDGDIYILRANGEIAKLTAGAVVPFSINNLSPALHAPTRLITTNNMTAIYIFEPSEKRLVAIDKASGNIIKQYTNPLWQSPADVLIDQDKNTAYVLDSNIVYKFTL